MSPPIQFPRLTSLSHAAGCGCKLGSADLREVLRHLPLIDDANVLVDAATRDDAAVYQIAPDRALVATVDFFTPIVDSPAAWGAITAAPGHRAVQRLHRLILFEDQRELLVQ